MSADALTFLFDVKNPHAYLALQPTLDMLDELSLEVVWQPLLVAPQERAQKPGAGGDRGGEHRWHRAHYRIRDLRRYALARGFAEDCFSDARLFDCGAGREAAAGILWCQTHEREQIRDVVTGLFERFWRGSLDLNSASDIDAALSEITGAESGFRNHLDEAMTMLDTQQAQLREAGCFDVPGYLLADEVYYGRQHLPVVKWLLEGAHGHSPAWGRYQE
jgi:2-hydroxychromene-2-carboxylate isomerase